MSEQDFSSASHFDDDLGPEPFRTRWITIGVGLLLVGGLLYLLVAAGSQGPRARPNMGPNHPAVGTKLGNVEFQPLNDGLQPIHGKDLIGKVTIVNYWGPWCGVCRLEFPELMEVEKKHRGNPDFQFLSVSCAYDEPADLDVLRQETDRYLSGEGYDIAAYTDALARSRRSLIQTARLTQFGFPTTLLLDRDGVIRGLWMGYSGQTKEELEGLLDELL